MRKILLLSLLLCAPWLAAGAGEGETLTRSVLVQGTAVVTAAPDLAYLNFAVQQRSPQMRVARDHIVRVTRDFLALTRKLGIPEPKVSSSGLNIQPEYRWDKDSEQQVLIGYLVQRELTVELENLDRLGELIEGALDAGINEVSPPRLDSSRRRELYREALSAAASDARSNAELLAGTLGVVLGPVISLEAVDFSSPIPVQRSRMGLEEITVQARAVETYRPGEIRLEGRVTARFELLPR